VRLTLQHPPAPPPLPCPCLNHDIVRLLKQQPLTTTPWISKGIAIPMRVDVHLTLDAAWQQRSDTLGECWTGQRRMHGRHHRHGPPPQPMLHTPNARLAHALAHMAAPTHGKHHAPKKSNGATVVANTSRP
jgi:hypothetical protein